MAYKRQWNARLRLYFAAKLPHPSYGWQPSAPPVRVVFAIVCGWALLAAPTLGQTLMPGPEALGKAHNAALAATEAWAHIQPEDVRALHRLARHLTPDATQAAQLVADYHQATVLAHQLGIQGILEMGRTTSRDRQLVQRFFALPDTLSDVAWHTAMTHLTAEADATPSHTPLARHLLAVARHSTTYWDDTRLVLPADSPRVRIRFQGDSLRKVYRRRIAKADAAGVMKGFVFGTVQFAIGTLFLDIPYGDAGILGGITTLGFSVFDSFDYARKLKRGQVRIEDDPWWGPDEPVDSTRTRPFILPPDRTYDNDSQ